MIIPCLQFRSKSIIRYNQYVSDGRFIRTERQRISADKLKDEKTYTGVLCAGAKKRLTKSLENLISFAKETDLVRENGHKIKFRVNFITLTIYSYGQFIPGKEAQKTLLEPLLLWLRRKHGMQLYLWKAELQSNRSDCKQLHFHLTTDTYVPWEPLRDKWNELQREAGYLDSFFERHGHWSPNSTDVHALYKIGDPVAYIKKQIVNYNNDVEAVIENGIKAQIGDKSRDDYSKNDWDIVGEVTKDIQNKLTVGGKVWDCSLALKAVAYHSEIDADDVAYNLEYAVKCQAVVKVETDHCTIFKFRKGYAYSILPKQQLREYWKKRHEIYNYERSPVKEKAPSTESRFTIRPAPSQNNAWRSMELMKPITFKESLFSNSGRIDCDILKLPLYSVQ